MDPKPNFKKVIEETVEPTKVKDKYREYQTEEDSNLKHIVTGDDDKDVTDESDYEEA